MLMLTRVVFQRGVKHQTLIQVASLVFALNRYKAPNMKFSSFGRISEQGEPKINLCFWKRCLLPFLMAKA